MPLAEHGKIRACMQELVESALAVLDTDGYICFGMACLGRLLDGGLTPPGDTQGCIHVVRYLPSRFTASLADAQTCWLPPECL